MRIVVLALAALPTVALAEGHDTTLPASHLTMPARTAAAHRAMPSAQCENARMGYAIPTAGNPAHAGTLAEEPRGNLYRAVQRTENGCDLPVKIADGVGDKQR